MTQTMIEWADYTLNPIKGLCKYACSYCYARKMYKRFKWNEEIRFDENSFSADYKKLLHLKKP
jgi:DNA repair photolyase